MTTNILDVERLKRTADDAGRLLKALANTDRLLLLCQLSQEELCVQDLEERLDIHQPTLSQQLGVLRTEGLVETRREGKRIYYRVASDEALAVVRTLYDLYCRNGRRRARK
jgi:ArsR family transcriptional regulator